jgi:Zn-dependent protease with chaperone function
MSNLYPPNPAPVSEEIIQPSAAFKKEVQKVMGSIFLFFLVYIILIILALALAAGCVMLGIGVMGASGHIIGIIAGVGIMSIGIMVVIFLIKFIFSVKKVDETGMTQVKEADQPELFAFIRQLTNDTQTQFPKKIVLSPEVNASVFYNDSFWSMIFPVKKNLNIGLGLVNTVTLSEFKAVMAHEFGHFSQRSMKLGSFVYNVNKAIYNMLYENNDYGKFLTTWGNLHWAIGIFVWVTIQIVKGIQSILQGMYGFINKNYMGLSREMEFHADAVAASVSGSENLITALKKLEISDACYNSVIQRADAGIKNKEVFQNIYGNHAVVMQQYAKDYNLPLQNNTPIVDEAFMQRFKLSKLNIKNQWASHPSNEDREAHLRQLNIQSAVDTRSAWVLFNGAESLQKQISSSIYSTVPAEMKEVIIDEQKFQEKYVEDINNYKLPQEYNGYYDDRQVQYLDIEAVAQQSFEKPINAETFKSLFTDEKGALPKQLNANESDAQILQAIIDAQIDTKTFDYDSKKYEKQEAASVLEKVKAAIEQQKLQITNDETESTAFFFAAAKQQGDEVVTTLKEKYTLHFKNRKKVDEQFAISQRIMEILSPLYRGEQVSIEAAQRMSNELRTESDHLKPIFKYWIETEVLSNDIKQRLIHFVNANYQYFSGDSFFDAELQTLHALINDCIAELGDVQFRSFKEILNYQLELCKKLNIL